MGQARYRGAFGEENWLQEWTFLGPESDYDTTAADGARQGVSLRGGSFSFFVFGHRKGSQIRNTVSTRKKSTPAASGLLVLRGELALAVLLAPSFLA